MASVSPDAESVSDEMYTEEDNNFYLLLSRNPVRFEPLTKVTTIFFDEVNRQVFTIRLNGLSVTAKGPSEKVNIMFSLPDKGEIKSIKFSSDLKVLAIQRSPRSVDFVNFIRGADTTEYSQTCKGRGATILSFYWTGCYEIVYVTDQGIEYYQVSPDKKNLKLIKPYTLSVNWSGCLVCPEYRHSGPGFSSQVSRGSEVVRK